MPSIFLTPLREMSSVVPVAIAMLPEKVEHEAMALASPAFWMVMVADVLQAAGGLVSKQRGSQWSLVERTVGTAGSSQGREGDLHHGRHFV